MAPETAGRLYMAVEPGHGGGGMLTLEGAGGTEPIGAAKVYAVLDPQALFAVTDTEPATVPTVNEILFDVLLPLQPAPLTDHV